MAKIFKINEEREKRFEKQYYYDTVNDTFKTLDQRQRDDERHIHNLIRSLRKDDAT